MNITDQKVQELVDMLHDEDEEILKKFKFTIDDQFMSETESISFIRFIRSELSKRN
ncbi:hypothetical protein [Paenibacillus abyssi]|uniref:Uncharacterized protein n=1 Tax=Paenibacillus abyssi TaxID=1340531 RepID=A0A917FUM8_9BACL|nr:hypothetical protein [Paenibacillus abyssi]GGG04138.1 hypothetical protein GCM10010916_21470 [Paenibacillus abyssi]